MEEHYITWSEFIAWVTVSSGPFVVGGGIAQFILLQASGLKRGPTAVWAVLSFIVTLVGALVVFQLLVRPGLIPGLGAMAAPGLLSAAAVTSAVGVYAWRRTRNPLGS